MGQVKIHLDDQHERRLRRAARSAGVPVSRSVASLVEENTRNEWPEPIRGLSGAWQDFPSAEELREAEASDSSRESL